MVINSNGIKRTLTVIAVTLLAAVCMAAFAACGKAESSPQKLPTPDRPQKSGNAVVWNDDPLYIDFLVSVDGTEYKTSENLFDVLFALKRGESFDVKVKALGDGVYYADSDWSEVFTVSPIALSMELLSNEVEYKIKKCGVASGDIVLPQTFNGFPVTEIGSSAFENCNDVTSVYIPDGYTVIGLSAFSGCKNLESVILPDTLTKISSGAFSNCEKLKALNMPKSVTKIYDRAFGSGITDLTVDPDNPHYKAEGNCLIQKSDNTLVFANENSVIPSCVDAIAQNAIWTDKIETLSIPNGVKKLAKHCISSACTSLTRVQLPASVIEIETGAFDAKNITEYIVADDNPVYKSDCGHIIRKSDNVLIVGCCGEIVIPNYVTGIAEYAFYGRDTQSTLRIPPSVTRIGAHAFNFCKKLEYVALPDTLTELATSAFGCYVDNKGRYVWGVHSITVPEGCAYGDMLTHEYASPDCEIGYDDGYAYAYSVSMNIGNGIMDYTAVINSIVNWNDPINEKLPYRYGYTPGGYSATPGGNPIATKEELDQIAYMENNYKKVRVYPIWIAND